MQDTIIDRNKKDSTHDRRCTRLKLFLQIKFHNSLNNTEIGDFIMYGQFPIGVYWREVKEEKCMLRHLFLESPPPPCSITELSDSLPDGPGFR